MEIEQRNVLNKWTEYTLTNDHGISISLLNYGATITKWLAPDQNGNLENIVLNYDDYEMYEENPLFLGAVIGRVAGRIKDSTFSVGNNTYNLEKNDGQHHLHGGSKGLHRHLWEATSFTKENAVSVQMETKANSSEDGYPGNVDIIVTYTLSNDNQLTIEYEGHPNQETPIALTNHTYFNLTGNAKQTAENHHVTFPSSKMLELNSDLIPTGQLLDTSNTFDFTQGRTLKDGMLSKHEQHQIAGGGYDHYFIFDENPTIQVVEPQSGRRLLIETNQPGMILYSGNNIDDQVQVNQQTGKKYLGVCFETQAHPSSLHGAPLPPILTSQRYYQRTTFTTLTS